MTRLSGLSPKAGSTKRYKSECVNPIMAPIMAYLEMKGRRYLRPEMMPLCRYFCSMDIWKPVAVRIRVVSLKAVYGIE